jgi:rsbT co-antagonist protein RsbR
MIAFAEGKTRFEYTTMTNKLDGTKNHILLRALIPAGNEQSWERLFVAILDITERVQAEEVERRSTVQEDIIRAQRAALGELSTPVIPISEDIMVMPLVGALDSRRMDQVMEVLLQEVVRRRTTTAIVDITGVPLVNSAVADMLICAARAVRLLGARVMLTGIRSEVAQVLVELGVDMSGITTHGTLQAGIASATRATRATHATRATRG